MSFFFIVVPYAVISDVWYFYEKEANVLSKLLLQSDLNIMIISLLYVKNERYTILLILFYCFISFIRIPAVFDKAYSPTTVGFLSIYCLQKHTHSLGVEGIKVVIKVFTIYKNMCQIQHFNLANSQ